MIEKRLQRRRAEREALLARIIETLQADERVCAAWLFGSFGRETADEWSDLDLSVILMDEHAEAVKVGRQEYVRQIGEPLLIQEMPPNAPPHGAYLLTMYPGESGPHIVDWYWQPRSAARIPPSSRILFDRVGIPPAPSIAPLTPQQHAEAATNDMIFVWMMINVVGKKIIRKQPWVVLGLVDMIQRALEQIRWHVGERPDCPDYRESGRYTDPPPVLPLDQLALLQRIAQRAETFMPKAATLGVELPREVVQPTYQFLDMIEQLLSTES